MLYTAPAAEVRAAFHDGTNHRAYEMLGAHPCFDGDVKKWHFALWAPNAKRISLVGDFNLWNTSKHPMSKQSDGTWETCLTEEELLYNVNKDGFVAYQYAVFGADDQWRMKTDPFAFFIDPYPGESSRLCNAGSYMWQDTEWMESRKQFKPSAAPVNIYEVHTASWKRHEDGSALNCTELADELIPYVQEMGYTHIELLSLMEHSPDQNPGDQKTGFFSSSCCGTPDELCYFVDRCHQAGIGVILEWNPACFSCDETGLSKFDGTDLYCHPNPLRSEIPHKNALLFDFSRGEVCSYLLSSVCYWIDIYHADGICMKDIGHITRYDFGKETGRYLPNQYGGSENLDGIAFLRRMNEMVHGIAPGVMMIAGEQTGFPAVTAPAYIGGLDFSFEWNTDWTNDLVSYIQLDPVYRKYHHDSLTFSLRCAFSEKYLLPLPHHEVMHGKRSMLDKNPGDLWNKFAGLRALYGYIIAHPGKKLLFMGGEFGQFMEWKPNEPLDWFLLQYERHSSLKNCVKKLNHLYRELPAFYETDPIPEGFQWITANDTNNSVIAFIRKDSMEHAVLCITNFTPVFHPIYRVSLPYGGTLNELFNTDRAEFGGSNQYNAYEIHAQTGDYNGFPFWADVCVPPLSTIYLTYNQIPPSFSVRG